VHAAAWPSALPASVVGDPAVLTVAADVLGQVRKAKTTAKLSMRAEAARVVVLGPDPAIVTASGADLMAAGNIADFSIGYAPELSTEVTLAEAVSS
jgi:valyl-tRNA synthetase